MSQPTEYITSTINSVLTELGLDAKICSIKISRFYNRFWRSCGYNVAITENQSNKEFYFFIKDIPKDPVRTFVFNAQMYFLKEVVFYSNVMTVFADFQRRKIKDESKHLKCVPKCYRAQFTEENNAVIVLEDMSAKGFVNPDRNKVLSLEEIYLAMRQLGRFHALSIALKTMEPETFNNLKNKIAESKWTDDFLNRFYDLYHESCNDSLKLAVEVFSETEPKIVEKIKILRENMKDTMIQMMKTDESNEPFNVIIHGELWANNLMFKGEQEMCFLDFQNVRYGSPALDIADLLFQNTDGKTRMSHHEPLIDAYHHSVMEMLDLMGTSEEIKLTYSRTALDEQLRKFSVHVLSTFFYSIPFLLDEGEDISKKEIPTLFDPKLCVIVHQTILYSMIKVVNNKTDACKQRLTDIMKDFMDLGYLDELQARAADVEV